MRKKVANLPTFFIKKDFFKKGTKTKTLTLHNTPPPTHVSGKLRSAAALLRRRSGNGPSGAGGTVAHWFLRSAGKGRCSASRLERHKDCALGGDAG